MNIVVTSVKGIVKGSAEKATRVVETKKIDKDIVIEPEEDYADSPDIESLVDKDVEPIGLRPVTDFKTKDELEEYGKSLGIDLNKQKKIENMYKDLLEFVNA